MKEFEIWSEGYAATGESAKAYFYGTQEAETFKDACDTYADNNPTFKSCYNAEKLTMWGCQLFDNEIDARRNFG